MARESNPLTRRQVLAGLGAAAVIAGPASRALGGVGLRSATAAGPSVTIDLTAEVGTLPRRALGLSFEKSTLASPLFSPENDALVALLGLLGPGVLRIGGNSVEKAAWDADGPGSVAGQVSPADVDRLAAFARAVDWPVIYGTGFLSTTSSGVAAEAAVASDALGDHLAGVELCNEPDLYALDSGASAIAGTYPLFRSRWDAFAAAVRAARPGIAMTGPATCLLQTAPTWTVPFAADERGGAGISLLTQHYYRGFGGSETIDLLLTPDPLLASTLPELAAAATAAGAELRIDETNSFASGGAPGVSNTFASALWGSGLVLTAAAAGAAGVNVHTSGAGAGYPPFVQVGGTITEIRPLFYGLLLVAGAGSGALVKTDLVDVPPTVSASTVRRSPTSLAVVLINTDPNASLPLTIDCGDTVDSATVSRLSGSSLDATTGVTFGGASVGVDGSWSGRSEAVPTDGRTVAVTLAGASAALVGVTLAPAAPAAAPTTTSSSTSTSVAPAHAAATAVPATPELTG